VRITRPDLIHRARRRLAQVIERTHPDVVLTPAAWAHAIFAPVARRAGLPLALWVHDELTGVPWIERLAARHVPDALICNSQFCLDRARTVFPTTPACVVRCPLAFQAPSRSRSDVRSLMHVADHTAVIVNVSRMSPLKGQTDLVAALPRLRTEVPWECWIVGGAQQEDEAVYERRLLGSVSPRVRERVRFLGHRTDVADLLAAADVYCQPNRGTETFGLAIVEALYAGLPVVGTCIGGPAEIVTPECGRLVAPADPDALSSALDGCLGSVSKSGATARARRRRAVELCDPVARLRDLADVLGDLHVSAAA
jgi:glycosyltransferase involved in cell wall biosynthesis